MSKRLKIFLFFVAFSIVGLAAYGIGFLVGQEKAFQTPPFYIENANPENSELLNKVDFSIFWEAWRRVERDFLEKEKIDHQKMVYGAIRGMLKALEDPYTTFFDPQETEEFEQELGGHYQGVGMEVAIKNNQITVVAPLENTPAQKAGLMPGDVILKIDERSTEDMSLEEAVRLIRGEKGTSVKLLIWRKSWSEPKTVTLVRDVIKIPTLKVEFKEVPGLENPVAVIKIYEFNKILINELRRAYSEILKEKSDRFILDLRNNPGGYLDVAQAVAGWFLKKGEVVVWQESSKLKKRKAYRSYGPSIFASYPVVVLINGGTASGAEILAGALRDNRGILLVGEKSFGKGSVQEQSFLSDGSSLKITIAKWLTPKGETINEKGLTPDIEVKLTQEDWDAGRDPQMEKALEIIKNL